MHDKLNGLLARHPASPCFITLLLLALSGCGGGGGGGGGGTPPPPSTSTYGRFAYVANFDDDTVSVYIADNSSGQLRHNGYALTGAGPRQVAIHPSGEFAYTINYTAKTVSLFTIDSLAGGLTATDCDAGVGGIQDCALVTGGSPVAMAFSANGRYAYVASEATNTISYFEVDLGTATGSSPGTLTYRGDLTTGGNIPVSLRRHPSGPYLYLTHSGSNNLGTYEINASDGSLTSIASPIASGGTGAADMVISGDGLHAYVANLTSGHIGVFDIDATGSLTAGTPLSYGGSPRAMVIDQSGAWLYVVNADTMGTVSVFAIQSGGSLQQINCSGTTQNCPVGGTPEAIALDPTGQFVAVTNGDDDTVNIFTIDQITGELTSRRTLAARNAPGSVAYLSDTSAVTITPRFAYVANETSNDISTLAINANSGALSTVGTPVAAGSAPSSVTVDPTNRFAYVTNTGSNSISVYAISASTGVLSQISGSPFSIGQSAPHAVVIEPTGRYLYVVNTGSDTMQTFSINAASGALTQIGLPLVTVSGGNPSALTIDPTGRYLYAVNTATDNISAYSIDPANGVLTELTGSPISGTNMDAPVFLGIDPTGRYLYTANNRLIAGSCWVSGFTIDLNNGALTEQSNSPYSTGGCNPTSLAIDPLGEFVYATISSASSPNVRGFSIDTNTGVLTATSNFQAGNSPQSIAIDSSGRYLYTANYFSQDVSAFTINASSGTLSAITGSPIATGGSGPLSITTTAAIQ